MKYDVERAVVRLSVRELCETALLAGDLDLRPGTSRRFSAERAAIGAKVHRKLQAEAGVLYDAEVTMTNTTLHRGIAYEVSGRADGILHTDPLTVDEIKTVSGKAFDLPPAPLHDAQARCYAYFLCRERNLSCVQLRLTYYRLEDGKTKYLITHHSAEDLRGFYFDLLSRVERRVRLLIERMTESLPSVEQARFPYSSVRHGQDIMIRECYRDIRAGKRLFVEAPTGTGKTISALYPAVRAMGVGSCDKIFYLTAKAAARREAYRAAAKLFEAGARLRTVVLTSREQICRNESAKCDPMGISGHCNPTDCPYAKGFFDRLGDALCDGLAAQHGFSRVAVLDLAARYRICPYELQLELSELCDVVICDYNYVFDPHVYLRRYFDPDAGRGERYVFLIDEAHNLGDRAAAMYSASLDSETVAGLWRALPETEESLRESLEGLSVTMHGFRRLCEETLFRDEAGVERGYYLNRRPLEEFHAQVCAVRAVLDTWLRRHRGDALEGEVHACAVALKHFEVVSEHYDERFLTFLEAEGESMTVRLVCLDPSAILSSRLSLAHASVLFSATLTPPDYFADILGGGKDAVRISLPSPFDPAHCCLVAVPTVSTRFEDRDKSCRRVAALIAASVSGKTGNYIVYFPSYDYMEKVLESFSKHYPKVQTIVQTRGMEPSEREGFLNAFRDDGRLRVGFCVLGGSFSEGIDLPGGELIGVVIVGTGLPGISNERNILREYYDNTRERGYDYAYVYPGMNRVLQAAGRVIRREDDRGVIVLIDDRYAEERMKMLFPDHWSEIKYARKPSELAEMVSAFWGSEKNEG
ncbi:MAG: ATP-dependent DNA helicase [Clostridia bacterium]|nr:ATP-dependent DNA helicase [Clostridia bacterium]